MSRRPKVAVIIVNWNGLADTLECLASLVADDYQEKILLVVDNGSTDGSAEALAKAYPSVILICNGQNLGFTGANNIGLIHALALGAEYVLLLNNDTTVTVGAISQLVAAAISRPTAGILTPQIQYYDHPDQPWFAGAKLDLEKGIAVHDHSPEEIDVYGVRTLPWITGCSMFLPRHVAEQTKGFDDRYFLNWEDVDLSLRVRNLGLDLLLVPTACIYHKVSRSLSRAPGVGSYYHTRNQLLLIKTHVSKVRGLTLARVILRKIVEQLRSLRRQEAGAFWSLQLTLFGIWDGLTGRYGAKQVWPRREF